MRKVACLDLEHNRVGTPELDHRITAVGHERSEPGNYRWDGLKRGTRPYAVLQLTLDGYGHYKTSSRRQMVPKHHLMIARVPSRHVYHLPEDGSWRHYFCCVTGPGTLALIDQILSQSDAIINLGSERQLRQRFEQIVMNGLAGYSDSYTMSGDLYQFLMGLCRFSFGEASQPTTDPIGRALAWGQLHWHEAIDVSDLAEMSGLPKWHFSRLFRERTESSPAAWLNQLRMRQAAKLLLDDSQSVAEVGRRCGYPDPSHFGKSFRKSFGMTPVEFRSSGWFAGIE